MFYFLVKAPEPRTVMEALQQRHEEFIKRHQDAISKGDSSKARRLNRLAQVIIFSFKRQNFNCISFY